MKTAEQKDSSYHLLVEDFGSDSGSKGINLNSSEANSRFISIEIPGSGGLLAVKNSRLSQIVDADCQGEDNIFVFQPSLRFRQVGFGFIYRNQAGHRPASFGDKNTLFAISHLSQ